MSSLGPEKGTLVMQIIDILKEALALVGKGSESEVFQLDTCKLIVKVALNIKQKKVKRDAFAEAQQASMDLTRTYFEALGRARSNPSQITWPRLATVK